MQSQKVQTNDSAATAAAKPPYRAGRRARVPLSCDPCRSRKLKCNREQPCQNCSTRNETTSCKYKGSENGNGSGLAKTSRQKHADVMQHRIDHLQILIKNLIAQKQERPSLNSGTLSDDTIAREQYSTPPSAERLTAETNDVPSLALPDVTVSKGGHSIYKAATDWSDVLQEVNEIKKEWNQAQDVTTEYDNQLDLTPVDGPLLLSGHVRNIKLSELLATLPPKIQVDKLIHQFFSPIDFGLPTPHILHETTFMSEYNEHWRDPSRTNIMWLGLLFSILALNMLSYRHLEHEPPEYEGVSHSLLELYRLRTAQCLMIGDITKYLPYTLETLIFYTTAEYSSDYDNGNRGQWMMAGVIVRAAISMGYHREPSHTSSISALQAELRRRVWLCVIGIDQKASFLVGLPSLMKAIQSDTLEPRNLHDWELTKDTVILPPSRPLDEHTPVTFLIVRGGIIQALGRITDFRNALHPGSYNQVLDIDSSFHLAYEMVPRYMKMSILESSTASQIGSRMKISILEMEYLYHRGMCALHRGFLEKGRLEQKYNISRDRCIASGLALLAQQNVLHHGYSTKSMNAKPYWWPAKHVCILGAMILFLDLEHRRRGQETLTAPHRDVLLQALGRACAIWREVQNCTHEARRVSNILTSMLRSFEPATTAGLPLSQAQLLEPGTILSEQDQPFYSFGGNNTNDVSSEENVFDTTNEMNIDWATWETYIENSDFENAFEGAPLYGTTFDMGEL